MKVNIPMTGTTVGLLLLVLLAAGPARAESAIKIHGTLMSSPCRVNDGKPVVAEFGNILLGELWLAKASVPVSITCDEAPAANALTLGVKGTTTSFNTDAFSTDMTGLGIKLTSPGPAYGLNLPTGNILHPQAGGYVVTGLTSSKLAESFNLTAHLVQDSDVTLKGGEFSGTATLRLNMD